MDAGLIEVVLEDDVEDLSADVDVPVELCVHKTQYCSLSFGPFVNLLRWRRHLGGVFGGPR